MAGALDARSLPRAIEELTRRFGSTSGRKSATLNLAGLTSLDTPGALYLCGLRDAGVKLENARREHEALFDLVCKLDARPLPAPSRAPRWRQLVVGLGKAAEDVARDTLELITFVGRAAESVVMALIVPRRLRLPAISRHVRETGVDALPIVGLLAVMIAVVIAYQGVAQLRPYGGEELTIDLVAVSVLREMAVLVTSIIVAGRSGSAFAAEIGVMKSREEIDALQVMGLDPTELLITPRVIALVITLPLLTFFADVLGLMGGAVISHFLLHVSPAQYLDRVRGAADLSDFVVGLVKAPVFAYFIAVIGCMHGFRVGGAADSVGRETTRAVVKAIFLVIVLDALFSVLFEQLGV